MEWTVDKIEQLIGAADYSVETGLKKKLIQEIKPAREISFKELKEKVGNAHDEAAAHERRVRERHAPVPGMENTEAMNNDRAVVPGGR